MQGKVNCPGQGQVQMHKSRAKGRDKSVAAYQGNKAIVRTRATIKTKTRSSRPGQQPRAKIIVRKRISERVFHDLSRLRPGQ